MTQTQNVKLPVAVAVSMDAEGEITKQECKHALMLNVEKAERVDWIKQEMLKILTNLICD